MPSTITHAYFSMDLYNRLDSKNREALESFKNQFKIFAQGPDVFFFYNLLGFKKGKKIRELGSYMQQNETQAFFVNLITTIRSKKLEKNPEIRTFLYGFIAHYVLDMTMHPFILYKTGVYDKKVKASRKYFGGHEQMESYIDAYFMKIRGKVKPKHFKAHSFCFKETHISGELKRLIDDVFNQTFNLKSVGSKYEASIKEMKWLYILFRNDSTGIKKKLFTIAEILPFNIKMSTISYDISLNNNDYYLNLSKEYWHHPLNENDIYNYSFIELYSIALSKSLKLIEEVDKVIFNKKNAKPLEKLFPNLSYVTGKECELGKGTHFSF